MTAAAVDQHKQNMKVNEWLQSGSYASVLRNNNNQRREPQPKEPSMEEKRSRTYTFYNLNTQNDISNLVINSLCQKFNLEASEIIHNIDRAYY